MRYKYKLLIFYFKDLKHLVECEPITFVDLSHNDIDYDERILDIFI